MVCVSYHLKLERQKYEKTLKQIINNEKPNMNMNPMMSNPYGVNNPFMMYPMYMPMPQAMPMQGMNGYQNPFYFVPMPMNQNMQQKKENHSKNK